MTFTEHQKQASEIGYHRGQTHANYAMAYGIDAHETPEVPTRFREVSDFFMSGWEEGVTDYIEAQESES